VDSVKDTTGSWQNDMYNSNVENCLVKTAILTRLELSIGKGCNQAGYDDVRVLSGDVYQVGHLHHLQLGQDIEAFKKRHNLDMNSFEKAKSVFQATSGAETENMTWFKWLQTLEESLIGSWDQPLIRERQGPNRLCSISVYVGQASSAIIWRPSTVRLASSKRMMVYNPIKLSQEMIICTAK
jgi:hypothetical protein